MPTPPLSPILTRDVLNFLAIQNPLPTLETLDALLHTYTRKVPWESAFRIAKRARTTETMYCPRWPEEFWRDALERGGGGTCFEGNYAFFSLLRTLGFEGYLTINNMGSTVGCHTAIILMIDGEKWLADVGMPFYVALLIRPGEVTQRASEFVTYTVTPDGEHRYQMERHPHPSPNAFTLIDQPVDDDAYRTATIRDYLPMGYFLDQVVVNKIVDEQQWRFNSLDLPPRLEVFVDGQKTDHFIEGDPAQVIGAHFAMDVETIRTALAVTVET